MFEKEIIIVDDGSTDNTKKVIKKFKNIKYFFQKNSGKGKAVQRGIRSSTGQIILVQDADLEYDPVDYNKLLLNFKKQKKIAVFGSRYSKKNFFSSFKKISVKNRGFETDHELTIKLLKKGYKIIEVPIKYFPRSKQEGKKINIIDAFKAIITILKLKFL